MTPLEIAGVACLLYTASTLYIVAAKPPGLWQNGKIQGFVKLLGTGGATTFIGGWGLLVGALGGYLLWGMS